MKRSKDYKRMMKKWKRVIRKYGKDASTNPWDWSYGLDAFIQYLYFMRDFYTLGENVWQVDECRQEVVDTLNTTLDEYEAWVNCDDKYTKVLFKNDDNYETNLKHWLDLGYYQEEDSSFNDVAFLHLHKDYLENLDKCAQEYNEHKVKFFALLGENIEKWWD